MPQTTDPGWLLDQEVTPQAFTLHSALVAFALSDEAIWPDMSDLAALLRLSQRRSIRRYMDELVGLGVLDVELRPDSAHRGYVYTIRPAPGGESVTLAPVEHVAPRRPLTRLELARQEFNRSRGRKLLRAEIRAGLHVCVRCGAANDLQVDHKVALAADGGNEIENMQVLCGRCNRRKGTRSG